MVYFHVMRRMRASARTRWVSFPQHDWPVDTHTHVLYEKSNTYRVSAQNVCDVVCRSLDHVEDQTIRCGQIDGDGDDANEEPHDDDDDDARAETRARASDRTTAI